MPPVSVLMKPASGICNMSCDYCFYCDEAQKREKASYGLMTEETLKNVIRRTMLTAEGSISYAYQGGEPLLRGLDFYEKAMEFQKKYNRNHIRVSNALQTNGYAMDEEWCRFFKRNQFLIGISIDGIKETHNACRHDRAGGDTYEKVLQATELMDRYGVDYNILTVVNCGVAGHIEEIYRFYGRRGWKYQQYIACLDPMEERRGEKEYALQPVQYGRFLIRLFDMWYKDWKMGRQPYIRQFENYVGILLGYPPEACEQRGRCSVQYAVEADGSVYPCDFYMLDEYCLGNLNESGLNEIDQGRSRTGFVERSEKLAPECRGCRYFFVCRGGCQRNREYNPEDDSCYNYYCQGFQLFFDNCLERMREMAQYVKTGGIRK